MNNDQSIIKYIYLNSMLSQVTRRKSAKGRN